MTALITGASSGIGEAFARCFARDHHDLVLTARDQTRLEALATELREAHGVRVRVITADLGEHDAVAHVLEQLEGLRIDHLINNAGFGSYGPFNGVDLNEYRSMISVNMLALTEFIHRLLPGMRERGHGRILNVASTAAFQPGPLMAVYFATKAYVLSLSEALAHELRGSGVTMTCLCPGMTESRFGERAGFAAGTFGKSQVATSAEVAEYGYRAMFAGEPLAIHGTFNRILAFSTRLAPRSLMPGLVQKMMEVGHGN